MATEPSLDFESDAEPGRHVFRTFLWWHRFFGIERARRSANAGFILAVAVTVVWQLQRNLSASKTGSQSYNEKHKTLRH